MGGGVGVLTNGVKEWLAPVDDGEKDGEWDGRIERSCVVDGVGCEEHGSLMILLGRRGRKEEARCRRS